MPSKSRVERKVNDFIKGNNLDYKDVVVMGPSAVFALAGIAEDHSDLVVVGTTATNYAQLRRKATEVNGYGGVYLPIDGVMVQEGLPLSTETFNRIKCIALQSLRVRLEHNNEPAFKILDDWQRQQLAKKMRVKPELRRDYLSLDEQLEYQDILEYANRELDEEEQFVLRVENIDWSHQMSDCGSTWRAGEAHRKQLTQEAADKFGPDTTLAKKFADICQWGYNGYSQLHAMYPWLQGYNQARHKSYRGMVKAAMANVPEDYIRKLREVIQTFDKPFGLLPTDMYRGFYVMTDATPPLFKMREAAKDTGAPCYYGIAVPEAARIGMNEALKSVTIKELIDIDNYRLLGQFADNLYGITIEKNEVFTSLTDLTFSGPQGRTYRFLVNL